MKTVSEVFAIRWHWWAAVTAVVLAGFLLRFAAYDHPIARNGGDGSANYLVADHVLRGDELPITGPSNAFVSKIGNSPFYYYVVIAMAALWHSPEGVAILYMILECLPIICLFFVGRIFFNNTVGLLAMSMLAFSPAYIVEAAEFLWQPYVMECFLVPAVLLFALAWKFKKASCLYASQALFVASIALHMSAAALLPLYLVFAWLCARRIGGAKRSWISLALTALLFLVFFLPNAFYASHIAYPANDFTMRAPTGLTWHSFFWNLTSRIYHAASTYFLPAAISLVSLAYLYVRRIGVPEEERRAFKALWLTVIAVSVFNLIFLFFSSGGSPTRYFVPMYWALALISAAILQGLFLRSRYTIALGVALIAWWSWQTASSSIIRSALENIPSFERPRSVAVLEAGQSVARDIERLRQRHGYDGYDFFGLYGVYISGYAASAILWQPVEQSLGVYFEDFQNRGYSSVPQDFMFLFCAKNDKFTALFSEKDCLEKFAAKKPDYTILQETHQSEYISVFLARKG